MSRIRSRLTFANVVSVLALFVALGGTATAAVLITGKNVKDGTLTGKDIKNSSLGSVDIKNGNLLAKDFKAGQLPAGPQGAQGPQGVQGLKGDKGDKGDPGTNGTNGINGAANVTYRTFLANFAGNGTLGEAAASCNAGEKLIGGGGGWVNNANPPTSYSLSGQVSDSGPATAGDAPIAAGATPAEWHVSGVNTTGANARMFAYAICATP